MTETTDPAPTEPQPSSPTEGETVSAGTAFATAIAKALTPPSDSGDAVQPAPATPRSERMRGLAIAALGLTALFVQLASSRQLPHGALIGAVSTLVATFGLLRAFSLLGARDEDAKLVDVLAPLPGEPTFVSPRVTVPLALVLAGSAFAGLMLGGHGHVHVPDGVLAALFLASAAVLGLSAYRRPALLPLVALTALYLPRLGAFALWDPWETHYGEVAREILSRDDWISLWWAQENWFWSKPILIFWSEAWSMSALGVSALPDANPAHPEWALRMPIFVMSMAAALAVQAFGTRAFGRRAGILSALVVGTMPHFFMLAHQAITDMPLVASLTVALCLLGLATLEPDEYERVPARLRIGSIGVSFHTLAVGAVLAFGLPQVMYLLTRNVSFFPSEGWSMHVDVFLEGSAGNYGVPGNAAVRELRVTEWYRQPALQALLWLVGLAFAVLLAVRARSRRAVFMIGFYVACAFGFLGKGIPGFALPGLVALFYLIASRRWSLLFRGALHVGAGVAIIAALGLPWYVAMSVRHGRGFLDRILVHDHINRLASGVHGDNGPIDYFLGQLGYGTFPWVGLLPLAVMALAWLPRGEDEASERARDAATFVGLWAMAAFTLFNAMVTKFHHYIFPVVPPAGLLVGVLVDRLLGPAADVPPRRRNGAVALAAIGTFAALAAVAGAYGSPRGIVPTTARTTTDWVLQHPWPLGVVIALAALAVLAFAGSVHIGRNEGARAPTTSLERGLAVAALGAAVLVAFVGRDTSWATATRPHGQERMILLFTYLYSRPFPSYVDFRPIFSAFAVVGTLATAGLAFRAARRTAATALLTTALTLTAFAVNVYLPEFSEHWSTHGLVERYYDERRDASEPLVAFQMNWKGENFYTGNRVHVFQDLDTAPMRRWLEARPGRTFFVVVQHERLESFRGLMPTGSTLESLTTQRDNNKFVLARGRIAPPPGS